VEEVIALSLEFKKHGGWGPQGPGDALRLAHCLRNPTLAFTRITVVSAENHRLHGLITNATFRTLPGQPIDGPAGSARPTELGDWIYQQFGAGLEGGELFHTFIGVEKPHPWGGTSYKAGPVTITRRRIDSSDPNKDSLLFWDRWTPPPGTRAPGRVVAAFIRQMQTQPKRNTPPVFVDICREVAGAQGYKIVWCGDVSDDVRQSDDEVLEVGGSTFLEQISALRARVTAAVGWNSGGLDLASAAALPVLRIGEFQASGGTGERVRAQTCHRWGARYNSFLACATNIGLTPRHLEASRFPPDVVRRSLAAFLVNVDMLTAPRHVILPVDICLASDFPHLQEQLRQHEVPWPDAA
jgi:hypothetical protein